MIKRILYQLKPPSHWQWFVIILIGVFIGLIAYLFYVSNAYSYLSDDPKTCVNCHIMAPQYATWSHSAHREVTNCNDCHVPHDNVFNKYFFKAKDGMRHATIFTLRAEPQVIKMHEPGQEVVQDNCIRCHAELISENKLKMQVDSFHHHRTDRQCWECHRETPHGKVKSLSSVPHARVPLPESPVPDWIRKALEND